MEHEPGRDQTGGDKDVPDGEPGASEVFPAFHSVITGAEVRETMAQIDSRKD